MSNKKKSLFFSSGGSVELGIPLIMEVNTQDVSSADSPADSIILPFDEGNTVNLQIDWGDGSALEPYTDTNLICTHQYALGGFYDIKIYNLNGVSRIPWNITNVATNRRDYSKFYDLKQFGDCEIYQLDEFDAGSFKECTNLDVTATDIGERCVELCVNAFELFRDTSIVEAKNSANWDTSNITDFGIAFFRNTNIIIDVSNWEMSQATSLRSLFNSCGNINPDVTNWDISSNCESLFSTFRSLLNFERDLSNWDVSGVTSMLTTFESCTSFTGQGLDTWVTSSLADLQQTFQNCTSLTTVNLSSWDVSNVNTMLSTFRGCTNFTGNGLQNWTTTSALTNLQETFNGCTNFNGNLQNFDVSGVTTMFNTFRNCTNFIGNGLDSWVTSSSLRTFRFAFNNCNNFNGNLQGFDVSRVTDLRNTFQNCTSFIGNGLQNWVTNDLTLFSETFRNAPNFNADISGWNTSNVTNMFATFFLASSFNQDLSSWDFSNVTNMDNWGQNWGMDTNNYDLLLLSLSTQSLKSNLTNVRMSSKYTAGEVTNGVNTNTITNKIIDSTQNFTSTVNVGDVVFNKTRTTYAKVVTLNSNTELTLDRNIMFIGDTYSVEGSNVAKARYFVVKTYNWQIIDDGQAFDIDYRAVLDLASSRSYLKPSDSIQQAQNDLIISLKNLGIWGKLDFLQIYADGTSNNKNFKLIDWVNRIESVQPTGVETLTSEGVSGFSINTNFSFNSGTNYTQNDAFIGGVIFFNAGNTLWSQTNSTRQSFRIANSTQKRINSAFSNLSGGGVNASSVTGFIGIGRSNSSNVSVWLNSTEYPRTQTSSALQGGTLSVNNYISGAQNNVFTVSFLSSNLNQTDINNFRGAINTYLQSIGLTQFA